MTEQGRHGARLLSAFSYSFGMATIYIGGFWLGNLLNSEANIPVALMFLILSGVIWGALQIVIEKKWIFPILAEYAEWRQEITGERSKEEPSDSRWLARAAGKVGSIRWAILMIVITLLGLWAYEVWGQPMPSLLFGFIPLYAHKGFDLWNAFLVIVVPGVARYIKLGVEGSRRSSLSEDEEVATWQKRRD